MDKTEYAKALIDRGVNPALAVSLLFEHGAIAVKRTIDWYDAQHGRVGSGVLVSELRAGGSPHRTPSTRSRLEGERHYGEQIDGWLSRHFADLRQADGRPHIAAVSAVARLHMRDGKGRLTPATHGAEIREAVRAFDREWGTA